MASVSSVLEQAAAAKKASHELSLLSCDARSHILLCTARVLRDRADAVLKANALDLTAAHEADMSEGLIDRLMLTPARLEDMASSLEEISRQPDPLGRVVGGSVLASGIHMQQITVPMGVVCVIYEARPNVTIDAFALCIKSGNAAVLKGGSAAKHSCAALSEICKEGLRQAQVTPDAIQYIMATSHEETQTLMRCRESIDLLIPRGSARLIQSVVQHATIPTIETGVGNCHIYLHASYASDEDLERATRILINAKCSRPGVCNACESLLVDEAVAEKALPVLLKALASQQVEVRGCARTQEIAKAKGFSIASADEEDWGREYLDLILSVRVVSGLDEAIAHINRYGTGHSEAILTNDFRAAQSFCARVDAAAVYVNASTRFTDGGCFGMGAEIGISTQKLHARGPMGAFALTTTKYLLIGDGQIR